MIQYPKKLTSQQQFIRDVLMDCGAIERLYVDVETVNPDVITPNELAEIVIKMESCFRHLKVTHGK